MATSPHDNYTFHMENFEFSRFEISKIFYTPDGSLIEYVEATMTVTFINNPHKMDLTRAEMIDHMRSGDGFYLDGQKLLLETIDGKSYIHQRSCEIPHDFKQ